MPSSGKKEHGPRHEPTFVVQQHDARTMVPTEDHPLDYENFEGMILQGGTGEGPS